MPRRTGSRIEPNALESIARWKVADALDGVTQVACYRAEGQSGDGNRRQAFAQNTTLWRAIVAAAEVTERVQIELKDFFLSEWMPLRPGLFHTQNAAQSRRMALQTSTIRPDDAEAPDVLRQALRLSRSRRGWQRRHDHIRLFDPHGKMQMIDGGIGCVRLKPVATRANHRWMLGASSTGVMHEGVPVALDDNLWDRYFKDIRRAGGLRCTVRGTLRFVPSGDTLSQTYGRGIPQLYVEASEIDPSDKIADTPIEVTAVATFVSQSERYRGLNASYVTFFANDRGDLEDAANWLEEIYVREAYAGRIITDFDEQTQRFSNATFSLNKLMNGLASREESQDLFGELGLGPHDREHLAAILEHRAIYVSGDAYFVRQAGAVGPNSQSSGATFNSND